MLKVDEIIYPITFDSYGVGKFKFTSRNNGVETDIHGREVKYNGSVDHFVDQNNRFNPDNSPAKDYYYTMAEKRENDDILDALHYLNVKPGQVFVNGAIFTASIGAKDYDYICNIEDMPLGATLLAIQNDDEFEAITFTAKRVEIYDDVITLLSGYAGGSMPKRTQTYAAELNIKRGTLVKYSTN